MCRIFVADDDRHAGQAVHVWLMHDFRVSAADSGTSGLAALDNAIFDPMIVDVFMPNMRGFEAIRLFHQRAPTVPPIAISGYAFAETGTPAPECPCPARPGAMRCLRKPFRPAALLGVTDECLSEAEPHRRQVAAPGAARTCRQDRNRLTSRLIGVLRSVVSAGGCPDDALSHPKLRRSSTAKRNAVGVAIRKGDQRAARRGL